MIVLSWNCRGLGNLRAGTVLSHLVREKACKAFFSHGDKANSGQDEEDSTRLTI